MATIYAVKYYDKKLSKRGAGTQVRGFRDRGEADAFAAANRIYGGPCRVEEREEAPGEAPVPPQAATGRP
jgi:hypothetical protein